jgi:hypothetical protein
MTFAAARSRRGASRAVASGSIVLLILACGGEGAVGPPLRVVTTIEVSPGTPTLTALGATQRFTAVAKDADGSPMSEQTFAWSSTDLNVARVDAATGLATAAGNGTTTVRAAIGAVSGSATLGVEQVTASIEISPAAKTLLAAGQTHQFSAVVRDALGSAVAGAAIAWSSSATGVATMDATTGQATARAAGTTTITATSGSVEDDAALTVRNGTLVGDYVLLTDFGNVDDNAYLVDGIFAVWWHKGRDLSADARVVLDRFLGVRAEALQLGLKDPPNPAAGSYVNIYLHVPGGGNDNYPDSWANGVGTDGNGLPYLTLPVGFHLDHTNHRHEGLHLFQFTRNSPGFAYGGDAAWYTEASANWFAAQGLPGDVVPFIAAALIPANPHLALWQAFGNGAPGDPANWNRDVRQYAMNTWLHYLTSNGILSPGEVLEGYNAGTTLSPQEYLFTHVPELRSHFATWAAHNTNDMDYLSREQVSASQNELRTYADPADLRPWAMGVIDSREDGIWLEPPTAVHPRGWSYSVIQITIDEDFDPNYSGGDWRFELDGGPVGTGGAPAHFEARVLVRGISAPTIHSMPMTSAQDGAITIRVDQNAREFYLVVAAVPAHFAGNQTYPYRVKIDRLGDD